MAIVSDRPEERPATDWPMFATGFLVSFLSAWVCVQWLLRYIATHKFTAFAWYRIGFGVLVLVTHFMGWVRWTD